MGPGSYRGGTSMGKSWSPRESLILWGGTPHKIIQFDDFWIILNWGFRGSNNLRTHFWSNFYFFWGVVTFFSFSGKFSDNKIEAAIGRLVTVWITCTELVFSLNIMLRVFSTPAPESSQFILKLQFSDPCRAPGDIVIGTPPYRNSN